MPILEMCAGYRFFISAKYRVADTCSIISNQGHSQNRRLQEVDLTLLGRNSLPNGQRGLPVAISNRRFSHARDGNLSGCEHHVADQALKIRNRILMWPRMQISESRATDGGQGSPCIDGLDFYTTSGPSLVFMWSQLAIGHHYLGFPTLGV